MAFFSTSTPTADTTPSTILAHTAQAASITDLGQASIMNLDLTDRAHTARDPASTADQDLTDLGLTDQAHTAQDLASIADLDLTDLGLTDQAHTAQDLASIADLDLMAQDLVTIADLDLTARGAFITDLDLTDRVMAVAVPEDRGEKTASGQATPKSAPY